MLSVIVCSRSKTLSEEFIANLTGTVGVNFEVIAIDNSENTYTIFSAYNEGYTRSKYPYLCFVHEDVFFHSQNWGQKVITHLQDHKTGIIGIAGGDWVTRIPASWSAFISPSKNIIESDRTGKKPSISSTLPEGYTLVKRSVIILDGVFMCMRNELMQKIRFDEKFDGFHGYDFDISIQSTIAGYTNYVVYDFLLEHFSRGKTDIVYFSNLIKIHKKWEKDLPLINENITKEECLSIYKIERKKLLKLTHKLTRKGFRVSEIKSEITYFANIIGFKRAVRFLSIRIFFIRLVSCPQYLFK